MTPDELNTKPTQPKGKTKLEKCRENVESYVNVFNDIFAEDLSLKVKKFEIESERSMVVRIQELIKGNKPWYKKNISYEEARILGLELLSNIVNPAIDILISGTTSINNILSSQKEYYYELEKEKQELRDNRAEFRLEQEVFHNDNKLKMEEISYQKDKNRYEKENLEKDREEFGRNLQTQMEQKETIARLESENKTIKEVMAAQSDSIKEYKALVKDLTEKLASISKEAVNKEIKFPELNFTNKNKQ